MISRELEPTLRQALRGFPVLGILGPRQSGKTTLARALGAGRPYASLEDPDVRAYALEDPRGFLAGFPAGAVLDEIQRCPALFSYLQGVVDARGRMGEFIVTGSQQFGLLEAASQSLAGRIGLYQLPPFCLGELQRAGKAPEAVDDLLWRGLFPPVYDREVAADQWLRSYVATYIERDVRQVANIQDLEAFQRFVQLCAGRVGQLLNVSSLAGDAGISRATAEAWLSILEASFLIWMVRPYSINVSKRLIKSPKLYFCDPGLASWLVGVREPAQLQAHPLRGALFENWVVSELVKAQAARGEDPRVYYLRDKEGHEVDAVVESGECLHLVEVKAGQTVVPAHFEGLDFWAGLLGARPKQAWLVYGGGDWQPRTRGTVVPWSRIGEMTRAVWGQGANLTRGQTAN